MRVTKVKLRLEHSDGYYTNVEVIVPDEVADTIATNTLDWERQWVGTVKEVKDFLNKVDEVDWNEVDKLREED